MDEYSEVTRVSWFRRLLDSVKSVVVGLLMFFVSFPLLWWNESRAVQTARSLDEGAGAVVSVSADKVDASNEGKLVHLSALAQSDSALKDSDFGVEQKGIKLVRSVEMYQWVESKREETVKKVGGSEEKKTTYRYDQQWSPTWQDSKAFKVQDGHGNPEMPYGVAEQVAQNVALGAFALPAEMAQRIEGAAPLPAEPAWLERVTPTLRGKVKIAGGALYVRPAVAKGDFDPAQAEVGDLKVHFSLVKAAEVSVVAQQRGSSFVPFQTKAGDALSMIKNGRHSAEAMFASAKEASETLTWILRAVGFLLMAIGIGMVLRPLAVVADVVPLFGGMLRLGIFFASLAVAVPLSVLTIGVAWIAVRPVLGAALLVLGVAVVVGAVLLVRRRKAAVAAGGTA